MNMLQLIGRYHKIREWAGDLARQQAKQREMSTKLTKDMHEFCVGKRFKVNKDAHVFCQQSGFKATQFQTSTYMTCVSVQHSCLMLFDVQLNDHIYVEIKDVKLEVD